MIVYGVYPVQWQRIGATELLSGDRTMAEEHARVRSIQTYGELHVTRAELDCPGSQRVVRIWKDGEPLDQAV